MNSISKYNQDSQNILLLTVNFPYGNTESFLSNELKCLSKKGSKISIYAHSSKGKSRYLPHGIKVVNISTIKKTLLLIFGTLYAFLKYSPYYFSDLISEIREERRNILKFSRYAYIINYFLRSSYFIAWFDLLCSKNKKDLIIYSYWMNAESYAMSILKRSCPELKVISRVHGGDLYSERNSGYLPFRNLIIDKLDRIFTISNHGKSYLLSKYIITDPNKIILSRLGVPKQKRISNILNRKEIVVASCSSDEPIKRVEKILLLLGDLSISLNKKISWIHVGIESKAFMKKYLKKLNSYRKLSLILPGVVPNNEISNIYKNYEPDFFINLSSTEGVPVSIMEALSFGIPVIATDVGGTSEITNDSVGAIIDSDLDFNWTINEINRVLENRNKLSENAYQQWKNLCSDEKNYIKFYNHLVEIKNDQSV